MKPERLIRFLTQLWWAEGLAEHEGGAGVDSGNGTPLDSSAAPSERLTWLVPSVEGKEF